MPGRPIDNERKACDAVARSLEELANAKRLNGYSPEDQGSSAPVDYAFYLDGKKYAIEHTVVEAFRGQINTGIDFGAFIAPIEDALDHKLPVPGMFRLSFPIDPSRGIKRRDMEKVQAAVIAWVQEKALELHAECPEQPTKPKDHSNFRKGNTEGLSCEIMLHRETGWWMPEKGKGRLFAARFAPPKHEELRKDRIEAALKKKLPKLKSWKDQGARSVLLLENGDCILSNHIVILEAVEYGLVGYNDHPDEVWLVDTTIETEWTVLCLIRDGVSFLDEETSVRFFDPADLTKV